MLVFQAWVDVLYAYLGITHDVATVDELVEVDFDCDSLISSALDRSIADRVAHSFLLWLLWSEPSIRE